MSMQNAYSNMKFPVYEFKEYPKHVTGPDGKVIEVQNAYEEAEILNPTDDNNPAGADPQKPGVPLTRAQLFERAAELGIPYAKNWPTEKLVNAIGAAEKAQDGTAGDEETKA